MSKSKCLWSGLIAVALNLSMPTFDLSAAGQAVELTSQQSEAVSDDVLMPAAPPVYTVRLVSRPPAIDGKLDDAAWQGVPLLNRFYQDNGNGPMKWDTNVRLVRDAQYLYLGVECLHPDIAGVPIVTTTRDKVRWDGNTLEIFLHGDRTSPDFTQIIFDMGGAFTDMFAGNELWDGDIEAKTEVGGTGWRLEARLKLADMVGVGKAIPQLWGFNIARNMRGSSGSWARLIGNYQQPDLFGLLTFAGAGPSVEALRIGTFVLPDESARTIPVHLRLANGESVERKCTVELIPLATNGPLKTTVQTLTIPAGATANLVQLADAAGARSMRLTMSCDGKKSFEAELPIRRAPVARESITTKELSCVVRPAKPVWLGRDAAKVYLMAQSYGKPWRQKTELRLLPMNGAQVVWQTAVNVDLAERGFACRTVTVPTADLAVGSYRLEWRTGLGLPNPVAEVEFLAMDGLKDLNLLTDAKEFLRAKNCPIPADSRDLALVQVRLERLAGYMAAAQGKDDADLGASIAHACQQLMELVNELRTNGRYADGQRGWRESAFYSPVDGSAQPYSLYVPYDYAARPGQRWPLEVVLHGSGSTHGGEEGYVADRDRNKIGDRLVLRPLGRGRSNGYGGVPGNDVINEIAEVKANYRIDDDRVHLTGNSMGGGGSFSLGAQYPDLFATCKPLCGYGAWVPLEQMVNLPTFVHHGLADATVAVSSSILAVERMKYYGCPVQLYLYPNVGHKVGDTANRVTPWESIKDIRRDLQPTKVILSGNILSQTHAYWLSVGKFADLSKVGFVCATFVGGNHLNIRARNVEWLKLSLPCKWVAPERPLKITLDGGRIWMDLPLQPAATAVYIQLTDAGLTATLTAPPELADPTLNTGGGAAQLFCEGRPLRIVYGTLGNEAQKAASEKLAKEIKHTSFSYGDFQVGSWPLLKDSEVTAQVLAACDLVLLGGPGENALVARMAKDLPVKFKDGAISVEADAPMQWPTDQVAFTLYYRNPLQPERRIWWVAGMRSKEQFERLTRANEQALTVWQPGKGALLAYAYADAQWKLHRPGPHKPAAQVWKDENELRRSFVDELKKSFPVDLAVLAMDPQVTYDWSSLTAGEAVDGLEHANLFILRLTGGELKRWQTSLAAPAKSGAASRRRALGFVWAGMPSGQLVDDQVYRVLLDSPVAGSLSSRAEIRVAEFVSWERVEPVAQSYLQALGLRAAPEMRKSPDSTK